MLLSTSDERIIILLPHHFDLRTIYIDPPPAFSVIQKTGYYLPKNAEK